MQIQKDWADEVESIFLISPGKYDFAVSGAEPGTSKKGNEMIVLQLNVFDGKGGKVFVRDWLTPAWKKKVVDFCRCVGLGELVDKSGELTAPQCLQRTGVVHIGVEEYTNLSGEVKKVNRVDRYEAEKPLAVPDSDDIPF